MREGQSDMQNSLMEFGAPSTSQNLGISENKLFPSVYIDGYYVN